MSLSTETIAPLGAGIYTGTPAVLQRETNIHADRYVFCLEDINVRDRILPIKNISRGRIARITDRSYMEPDMSEEALTRENSPNEVAVNPLVSLIKTAFDSSIELYSSYGERGLIILDSLTGIPATTVKAVEEELLAEVPHNIQEFKSKLLAIPTSDSVVGRLVIAVRDELLNCADITATYRADIVNKAQGEIAQRSKPNGVGLDRITTGIKFYADSLGIILDSERLEQIANKQNAPIEIKFPEQPQVDIAAIVAEVLKGVEAAKAEPAKKTK